jgi:tRNA threonylcarbamoyladenosine biosynthesis protein TsaE
VGALSSTAQFEFVAYDERDTDRLGAALADVLPPGAVVALVGTLGAGKTRLVQAIAKAVGIDPAQVVSPTFVLVHEYQRGNLGSGVRDQHTFSPGDEKRVISIYHLDAYRIRDDDEFLDLGPEEYFESDAWTFVEWADRVAACLPREHLRIEVEVMGATARRFTATSVGDRFQPSIDALCANVTK